MAHADDAAALIHIAVVYSPRAGVVDEVQLSLSQGATVAQALSESGLQARHAALDLASAPVGVWGALRARDEVLRDRDRVEVYRPLLVEPKEARRRRQRAQIRPGGSLAR